jgi:hypothetical protein
MESEQTPLLFNNAAGSASDGDRVELHDIDDDPGDAHKWPTTTAAAAASSEPATGSHKKPSFFDNFTVVATSGLEARSPRRAGGRHVNDSVEIVDHQCSTLSDGSGNTEGENDDENVDADGDDDDDSTSSSSSVEEEELPTRKRFVYRDIDDDEDEANNGNGDAQRSPNTDKRGSGFPSAEPEGPEEENSGSPSYVHTGNRKKKISAIDAFCVYFGSLCVHILPPVCLAGALLERNLFGLLYLSVFVSSCLVPRDMVQVHYFYKKIRPHGSRGTTAGKDIEGDAVPTAATGSEIPTASRRLTAGGVGGGSTSLRQCSSVYIALRPKSWLLVLSMCSSFAAIACVAGYSIACYYDNSLSADSTAVNSGFSDSSSSSSSSSRNLDYETWLYLGFADDVCNFSNMLGHSWISLFIFFTSAFSFVFIKKTGLRAEHPRLYGKWPVKYTPSNVVIKLMRQFGDDWLLCIAAGILTIFRQCVISLPFLLLFGRFVLKQLPSGLLHRRDYFSIALYKVMLLYTSAALYIYFACFALTNLKVYAMHRETLKTFTAFEQPTISDAPHFLLIGGFLWCLAHGCSIQRTVSTESRISTAPNDSANATRSMTSSAAAIAIEASGSSGRSRRAEKLKVNLLRLVYHSWETVNAILLFLTLNVAPSALGFLWSALLTCSLSSGNVLMLHQLNMLLGLLHFAGVAVVRVHGLFSSSEKSYNDQCYVGVEPRHSSSELLSVLLLLNIVASTMTTFAGRVLQVSAVGGVHSSASLPSPRASNAARSDAGSLRGRNRPSSHRRRSGVAAASLVQKAVNLGEVAAVGLHRLLLGLARQYFYLVAFFALFLAAVVRVNVLHCAFTVLFAVNVLRKSFPQLLWIVIMVYTIAITHALYLVTAFFSESGTLDQIGFYAADHDTFVLWPYYIWITVFSLQLRFTTAEKFVEISRSIRNYLVLAERVTISIIVVINMSLFAAISCTSVASVFGLVYLALFLSSVALIMNASSMHSPGIRLRRFWDFVILPVNAVVVMSCYGYQLSPGTADQFFSRILQSVGLNPAQLGVTETSFASLWPKVVSLLLCIVQSRGWATNSALVHEQAAGNMAGRRMPATPHCGYGTAASDLRSPQQPGRVAVDVALLFKKTKGDALGEPPTAASTESRLFSWLLAIAEKLVRLISVYSLPLSIGMLFVASAVVSGSSARRVSLLHLLYFFLALVSTLSDRLRNAIPFWQIIGVISGLSCAIIYVFQLPSIEWSSSEWLEYSGFPVKADSASNQWVAQFPHILLFSISMIHVALCTAARDGFLVSEVTGAGTLLASPSSVDSPVDRTPAPAPAATRSSHISSDAGRRSLGVRSSMVSNRSSIRASLTIDASRVVRSLFDIFVNPTTYFRFAAFHLSVLSLFTAACSSISNVYGIIYFLLCCGVGFYGKQGMSTHYRWTFVSSFVFMLMSFQFAVRLGMPPGTSTGIQQVPDAYKSYFGLAASTREMLLTMVVWCATAINRLSLRRHPLYRSFYGIMDLSREMSLTERLELKFENILLARSHNTLSYLYRLLPTPAGRHDFTCGDSLKDRFKLHVYTKFLIFVLLFMFLHAIYDATASLTVLKVVSILVVITVMQNWPMMPWKAALWWKYVLGFHVLWMGLRLVMFVPHAACNHSLSCAFLYLGLYPSDTLLVGGSSVACYGAPATCKGTPFGEVELVMHATVVGLAWMQSVLYRRSEYAFVLHYLHRSDVVAKELGNAIRKSRKVVIDHMKAEVKRREEQREKLLRREMLRHKSVSCVGRKMRRNEDDSGYGIAAAAESAAALQEEEQTNDSIHVPAPEVVGSMTELAMQHEGGLDRSMMVLGESLDYKAFALLAAIDPGEERGAGAATVSVLRRSTTAIGLSQAYAGSPLASPRTVMFDENVTSVMRHGESPAVENPKEEEEAGSLSFPRKQGEAVAVVVLDAVDRFILWLDGSSLGHGATRITQKQLLGSSRVGLLLLALYRFVLSYTDKLCYLLFALYFGLSPCVLNAVLPISVFTYACIMNPRPHRAYWSMCLVYMQVLILTKSVVKLAYCDNLGTIQFLSLTTSPWYGRICISDFFFIDVLLLLMCVVSVFIHMSHLRQWGLWDDSELDTSSDIVKEGSSAISSLSVASAKLRDVFHNVNRHEIKTGTDLYRYQFACELLGMIYIFFAYYKLVGSEDSLVNSLMQSLLPGSLAVALLLLFFFIVLDRVAYLKRNLQLKFFLNIFYAVGYHAVMIWWFMHQTTFNKTYFRESSFDLRGSLTVALFLYLIKSGYLYLSGLQVCRGLYSHLKHIVFTGNYGTLEFIMYMAARLTPFVFDMRVILDWTVMPTSLKMPYWIKLEDISHELYLLLVDKVDSEDVLKKNLGDKRKPYPASMKLPLGIILFLLLTTILMFPLLLYSSFSPALQQNYITSATATVSISSAPPLWQSASRFETSQFLNRTVTEMFERTRPGLVGLGLSTDSTQLLQMGNYSSTVWAMPPPATAELLKILNSSEGDTYVIVSLEARNGIASQTDASSAVVTQSRVLKPFEMTNLSLLLSGNISRVLIENLYSPFIFNKAPSYFRVNRRDFVDCYFNSFSSVGGGGALYFSVECRTLFMNGNPGQHRWQFSQAEAVCLSSDLQCPNYDSNPLGATGALSPIYFVTVSSAVFAASLLQQIGIVAAYTTFVFAIGRVLRFAFVGGAYRTSLEDMEDPSYLVSLVEYMCIARASGDFRLEQEIYTELVNTLRVTEELELQTRIKAA